MNRWCGKVGYEIVSKTGTDLYTPTVVERVYYGDCDRLYNHVQNSKDGINDDLQLNMQVRIVADAFAFEHANCIRYVEVFNSKWKVTSIEIGRPRITLNCGGAYTEEEPEDDADEST
jgi:hypothetical protein